MSRLFIIAAIAATYFIFAILLNSVGTVILQSINSFDVSKTEASTLEAFKDLSIAFVSFAVASFIPRLGYRFAMLLALVGVSLACFVTPIFESFLAVKLLFAAIGVSFAFVKVSVYSIVGQLSTDTDSHSSLLNTIEGIFMLGVLSGYWIFAWFIDNENPASLSWLQVYYPLAGVILLAALVVFFAPIAAPPVKDEQTSVWRDFVDMLKLTYKPLVLVFVISIFLYVLIEQGIGTWLPTFNNQILHLPSHIAVQMTSIFAAMIAIGRLSAGQILRFINWYPFLNICLALMALAIIVTLPLATDLTNVPIDSIFDAPLAAFLLPLAGLMMAPLYPVINSVMLSSLPVYQHSQMTGLIVVFSALGGTTGSVVTGALFDALGGQTAFYLSLVPIGLIMLSLVFFRRLSNAQKREVELGAV
ncbi:MFS transporter [Glaciecola siphonariae]|uniref:MFS transporter n=1 Tax=Glaciecola siphonariae TaxID=521012 RepID=A0ABV9LXV7_9ALTE